MVPKVGLEPSRELAPPHLEFSSCYIILTDLNGGKTKTLVSSARYGESTLFATWRILPPGPREE